MKEDLQISSQYVRLFLFVRVCYTCLCMTVCLRVCVFVLCCELFVSFTVFCLVFFCAIVVLLFTCRVLMCMCACVSLSVLACVCMHMHSPTFST